MVISIIGRLIDGFACGIGSAVAPIFSKVSLVKEVTPAKLCGKYGGLNQIFLSLGASFAIFLDFIDYSDIWGLRWWQTEYVIFIVLVLVHITSLIVLLPDTPHWYFERGDPEKAKSLVRRIINNPAAVIDTNFEIREEVRVSPGSSRALVTSLRKGYLVIALSISASGVSFAISYTASEYMIATIVFSVFAIIFSDRKL
jgi:hypothetical protein